MKQLHPHPLHIAAPQGEGKPMAELDPELLKFLMSRGQGLEGAGVDPMFAARLQAALQAGEAATGQQTQISDLYRSPERQAKYYAAYKAGKGGLAAPPGRSRHQLGQAADIRRGPVRDWMAENSGQYGIEPLKGPLARMDPVHFQMMRDWKGELPSMPQTAATQPPPGLPSIPSMPSQALAGIGAPQPGLSSIPSMPAVPPPPAQVAQAEPGMIDKLKGLFQPGQAAASVAPSQEAGPGLGKGIFGALAGIGQAAGASSQQAQQHQAATADAEQKRMMYWLQQQGIV